MNLPDVSVLVNALRPDAPQHQVCLDWLDRTARSQRPFAVTSTVLAGAVRVLTHPRVFDPPSDVTDVLGELERLRGSPNVVTVEPGTEALGDPRRALPYCRCPREPGARRVAGSSDHRARMSSDHLRP